MKYKKEVTVSFLLNSMILLSLTLFSLGCSIVQIPVVDLEHTYVLSIVDVNGSPLEGATIEYDVTDEKTKEGKIIISKSFITTTNGELTEIVSDLRHYVTTLGYKVSKDGYYPKSGALLSSWDGGIRNLRYRSIRSESDMDKPVETEKIVLIHPTDYLDKGFVLDLELKGKVIRFIDLIILESRLTKSPLKLSSINLVTFKEKNTFSLGLTT